MQKAVKNLFYGQVFDENFLMAIATVGAFALGEYSEGVAVMLFYQIGEFFQNYAVNKSRKSISGLMDIRPDYANLTKGKKVERVAPEEVKPGDVIMVTSGEKIPLDGEVVRGNSLVDTSAITGEAVPREVSVGDDVVSGCVNLSGVLYIKVCREFGQSTVAKILDLVENASSKKAPGRTIYYQICTLLHAGGGDQRGFDCSGSSFAGKFNRLRRLDISGFDIFGHFVSVCVGHFSTAELFRGYRGSVAQRYFG